MSTGLYRAQLKSEAFFELACTALGVEANELKVAGRSRELSRQRQLIVGLGVERWFQGTKNLASLMNRKADTGTAWVRRCIERRTSDSGFAKKYNELDEAVSILVRGLKPE